MVFGSLTVKEEEKKKNRTKNRNSTMENVTFYASFHLNYILFRLFRHILAVSCSTCKRNLLIFQIKNLTHLNTYTTDRFQNALTHTVLLRSEYMNTREGVELHDSWNSFFIFLLLSLSSSHISHISFRCLFCFFVCDDHSSFRFISISVSLWFAPTKHPSSWF